MQTQTMECPNCASKNRDNARYCNRCGQRLTSTSASMPSSSSQEYVSRPEQLASGIVQILDADENIVGTGFVVSRSGLIATCAHVIETKKLMRDDKQHPEKVTIVFQATSDKQDAQIKRDWCQTPNLGDVAILQIEGMLPQGVRPLPLGSAEGTSSHEICTFGFPFTRDIEGIGGDGKVVRVLTRAGKSIIQLRSGEITVGFSGAPVWDKLRRRVIGMVSDITEPDPHHRLIETAFAITTETLRTICPVLQISDVCPYRGLAAFGVDDAEFYFGRQQMIDGLLNRLRQEPRFLTILGPSGSGKSSAVQAGFIPQLKNGKVPGSDRWGVIVSRPADHPFDELVKQGLPHGLQNLTERVQTWLSQYPEQERLVLVFDQFEELFITCPEVIRQDFVTQLAQLLHAALPITIMLVMRDDFYSQLTQHEELVQWIELSRGPIHMPMLLKQDELIAMIQKPTEAVGLKFEEGLVEVIVKNTMEAAIESEDGDAAGRSSVLPLLEFSLSELWKRRQEGMLTHEAYHKIGGVAGALTQWADGAFFALKSEGQRQLAHRIFTDLVFLGDVSQGILDSRRRRTLSSLYRDDSERQSVLHVVQQLVALRLLVTDRDLQTNSEVVEIIHDTLLRTWRRLKQWIEEDRDFLWWHQKLEEKTQEWIESNTHYPTKRDDEKLLGKRELAVAKAWQEKRKGELGPSEKQFLEASKQRQRKIVQQRSILFSALSLLCLIAIVLASVAKINFQQAQVQSQLAVMQKQIARSHALATLATSFLVQNQQDRALLLSLEALKLNKDQITTDSLLNALEYSPHISTILQEPGGIGPGDTMGISGLAFSPDGHTLFSSDGNSRGNVLVWNLATKRISGSIPPLPLGNTSWMTMVLSPDGKVALLESIEGNWLWDVTTDTRLTQLPKNYQFVSFQPNGKLVISECDDHMQSNNYCDQEHFSLWDMTTHRSPIRLFITQKGQVLENSVLSANGKILALDGCTQFTQTSGSSICAQSQVQFWNIATGEYLNISLSGLAGNVTSMAFSPDGNLLATGEGPIVRLWKVKTGNQFGSPLTGHTGDVLSIAFSPDGKLLATGGDTTVRLWNVTSNVPSAQVNSGTLYSSPLIGHRAEVTKVAFSPDGHYLASGSRDNSILLWNLNSSSPISRHLGYQSNPTNAVLSPNEKLLVSCSENTNPNSTTDTVDIWDSSTGGLLHTLSPPQRSCLQISFSPDGKLLSAGGVWNVLTGQLITSPPFNIKESVFFNPRGHTFASSSGGNVIFSPNGRYMIIGQATTLWDITHERVIRSFPTPPERLFQNMKFDQYMVWDLETNTALGELPSLVEVNSVAFSPDSRTLAVITTNGKLVLWDVTSMRTIADLGNANGEFVAFSPDGKLIVTGGGFQQSTFRLWDVVSRQPITDPIWEPSEQYNYVDALDSIESLNFGQDGLLVVVRGVGITLWDVTLESWINQGCSIANRNFSELEWSQFAPNESYPILCQNLPFDASIVGGLMARSVNEQAPVHSLYTQATKWALLSKSALLNDAVCWQGSLSLVADVVMPACEQAVALDPNNGNYHDSRGLARAETGDTKGAIADFEFFITWAKEHNIYTDTYTIFDSNANYIAERERWVQSLTTGQHPFSKQMLNDLMSEKFYDMVGVSYIHDLIND